MARGSRSTRSSATTDGRRSIQRLAAIAAAVDRDPQIADFALGRIADLQFCDLTVHITANPIVELASNAFPDARRRPLSDACRPGRARGSHPTHGARPVGRRRVETMVPIRRRKPVVHRTGRRNDATIGRSRPPGGGGRAKSALQISNSMPISMTCALGRLK